MQPGSPQQVSQSRLAHAGHQLGGGTPEAQRANEGSSGFKIRDLRWRAPQTNAEMISRVRHCPLGPSASTNCFLLEQPLGNLRQLRVRARCPRLSGRCNLHFPSMQIRQEAQRFNRGAEVLNRGQHQRVELPEARLLADLINAGGSPTCLHDLQPRLRELFNQVTDGGSVGVKRSTTPAKEHD